MLAFLDKGLTPPGGQCFFLIEVARFSSLEISGGTIDIVQACDKFSRVLVCQILFLSGVPAQIVDAYARFHDNLWVYNGIAGGLGQPYQKRCSIPQGCPFSMMIFALLLRPMILLSRAPGHIIARLLADDLIIVGIGEGHVEIFTDKFNVAMQYVEDLGSRISPKKSFLFSN